MDRTLEAIAFVLSRRTPFQVPDMARELRMSRASAYRLIARMQSHFPITFKPGTGGQSGEVIVRRPLGRA